MQATTKTEPLEEASLSGAVRIDAGTLRSLSHPDEGPVVSIFMPTPRNVYSEQQYVTRLKTLLSESRPLLVDRGLTRRDIDRLEKPARALLEDEGFWRDRLDGLALYISPRAMRYVRVPYELPELVEVSDTACVRPLLPSPGMLGSFFILAFSRNRVRLLRGTLTDAHEIDLGPAEVPLSLSDALAYDDFERAMQSHATGRADVRQQTHSQAVGRSGKHVWHGHGGGDEQTREQTERFLRALDRGLCGFLAREPAPLILAAVAQERDLYRSLSRLPDVVEEGLDGNPDRLSAAELHDKAWPIAKREFDRPRTAAVEAYREATTVGEASDEAGEILRAVHEGRVATLLLDAGAAVWGSYDPIERRLWTSIRRRPRDIDILDLAARETLMHGGSVFALSSEEMPTGTAMAAIYRY